MQKYHLSFLMPYVILFIHTYSLIHIYGAQSTNNLSITCLEEPNTRDKLVILIAVLQYSKYYTQKEHKSNVRVTLFLSTAQFYVAVVNWFNLVVDSLCKLLDWFHESIKKLQMLRAADKIITYIVFLKMLKHSGRNIEAGLGLRFIQYDNLE